jgi:thiol:disulfide interchange protein/DsbC/DsbD-like thiol-disulfide interchange protein
MRSPNPIRPARLLRATTVASALCFAGIAGADPVTVGNVTAELVAATQTIRPGTPLVVGLSLKPQPDWHTYWKNPGDSGLATTIEWKLPEGMTAGPLEWPHPVRLGKSPFVTFGYERDVLLLTNIDAPASLVAGSTAELVATARWLACRDDACVPGRAELRLALPVAAIQPKPNEQWAAAFDTARSKVPRAVYGWSGTWHDGKDVVRIDVTPPPGSPTQKRDGVQVFATTARLLDASSTPVVRPRAPGFEIEVPKENGEVVIPETLSVVLVDDEAWDWTGTNVLLLEARTAAAVAGGDRGEPASAPEAAASQAPPVTVSPYSSERVPAAAPAPAANEVTRADPVSATSPAPAASPPVDVSAADVTFWAALGLAFLGGLVLNLMPCVFPVLSLKILGFVHVAHHDAVVVRRHGYAFAAGVLASFWVLAGALLILRAAGGAFGWGFQLQEPLFVAAMAALLLAMSLNLLGVFEFGSTLSGAVGRFDAESGYRGSFLSGSLATVLATPCSAPFMGTAVGYALVQPPSYSLAVFSMLGVGMASPYLVLACAPTLMRRLPRPGAWMEKFRVAMSFPLLATVAWLVWIFGQQTGNDGVLALLMALVLGSLAAWLYGRFETGGARRFARVFGALSVAGAVYLAVGAANPEATRVAATAVAAVDGVTWHPWDPEAITKHRGEGRAVLVDFTADWCLSCKVNERVALSGDEFAETMRSSSAVAMKADWTRSDPRISEALSRFGRSGVPLYVVYPSDPAREAIVLPQILTPAMVREAIEKAVS